MHIKGQVHIIKLQLTIEIRLIHIQTIIIHLQLPVIIITSIIHQNLALDHSHQQVQPVLLNTENQRLEVNNPTVLTFMEVAVKATNRQVLVTITTIESQVVIIKTIIISQKLIN